MAHYMTSCPITLCEVFDDCAILAFKQAYAYGQSDDSSPEYIGNREKDMLVQIQTMIG